MSARYCSVLRGMSMVLGEGGITLCVASAENIYVRVGPDSVFGAGYRIPIFFKNCCISFDLFLSTYVSKVCYWKHLAGYPALSNIRLNSNTYPCHIM